jgi:hypothetical protein
MSTTPTTKLSETLGSILTAHERYTESLELRLAAIVREVESVGHEKDCKHGKPTGERYECCGVAIKHRCTCFKSRVLAIAKGDK